MAKRFKEAFGKINEYFSDCYVRLFGGGTAALKLTDGYRPAVRSAQLSAFALLYS